MKRVEYRKYAEVKRYMSGEKKIQHIPCFKIGAIISAKHQQKNN